MHRPVTLLTFSTGVGAQICICEITFPAASVTRFIFQQQYATTESPENTLNKLLDAYTYPHSENIKYKAENITHTYTHNHTPHGSCDSVWDG